MKKTPFLLLFFLFFFIQINSYCQYYIKVERTFDMGGCWENRNWFNWLKTVVQPLKKNDNASCYYDGSDNSRNTQKWPLLYHNKACPEVLKWDKFIFDWVRVYSGTLHDVQEAYSEVQSIDDQINRIGFRNQGNGIDIENFNFMDSYTIYDYWYYWAIETVDPCKELQTIDYEFNDYSGENEYYHYCNQGYPFVHYKITIDNPIFLTLKSYPNSTNPNLILQYTPFYDNYLGDPVLECRFNGNEWKEVPNVTFNSAGGTITLNYPNYNFTSVAFRVRKTLSDGKGTLGYGNTLALDFSTLPTITTPSPTVTCNGSPVKITGAYSDIESSQFKCFLEAKLSSGTDDDWAPIKNTTFKVLPTGSSLYFSDITSDNSWLGKEILLRPYYLDYFGDTIRQSTFKSVVFLPEVKLNVNSTSATCHDGTDAQITVTPDGFSLQGAANPDTTNGIIPLLINIKRYGTGTGTDSYEKINYNGNNYYYEAGRTLKITNTVNGSLIINNSSFNDGFTLSPGIYTINGMFNRSDASCSNTTTFEITNPTQLKIDEIITETYGSYNIKENGGTASITASHSGGSGNINYKIDNGSYTPLASNNIISGINAGQHTLYLFDNTCSTEVSKTFSLSEPEALIIKTSSVQDVTCFGGSNGSFKFKISGGIKNYQSVNVSSGTYTYNSADTSYLVTNLSKGTCTVTVTDAFGTTATKSQSINAPDAISFSGVTLSSYNDYNIKCNGCSDAVTVNVTGGNGNFQYSFDGTNYSTLASDKKISGLLANTYHVYVKQTGCSDIKDAQFTLTAPDALSITTSNVTNNTCYGESSGSFTFNVYGGITSYQSVTTSSGNLTLNSNGSYSVTNLPKGTCTITVTDAFGTTATKSQSINAPDAISFSEITPSDYSGYNIKCNDCSDAITVKVTGGNGNFQYSFDGSIYSTLASDKKISGLSANTYTLYVKQTGCGDVKSIPFTLNAPSPLSINVTTLNNVSCHNGSDGNICFTLSGGIPSYKPVTISQGTLSVNGNIYSITNLKKGDCKITLNDAFDNTTSSTVSIDEPDEDLTVKVKYDSITCTGEATTITLTASGGVSGYQYYIKKVSENSPITAQVGNTFSKPAGTYTGYVIDSYNCTVTSSPFKITESSQLLSISTSNLVNSICGKANGGATITINGGEPNSTNKYNLSLTGPTTKSTSEQSSVTTYTDLLPGDYTVQVNDARGCSKSANFTISNTGFTAEASYVNPIAGFNMHSCDEKGKVKIPIQRKGLCVNPFKG